MMRTHLLIAAIGLTGLLLAGPAMASESVTASTERGYPHHEVRGYFGDRTWAPADLQHSIGQSRENGGAPRALSKAKSGYGIDTATSLERSREEGMR